jgi:RNA polymerase sigma factor (sigma-70 family)
LTWRRRRWRGEIFVADVPEQPDRRDHVTDVERRSAVLAALRELPPRQRAVVVLRFFDDLTEAQTADAMGCSVGTVKSQSAKALARLRTCEPFRGARSEEARRDTG